MSGRGWASGGSCWVVPSRDLAELIGQTDQQAHKDQKGITGSLRVGCSPPHRRWGWMSAIFYADMAQHPTSSNRPSSSACCSNCPAASWRSRAAARGSHPPSGPGAEPSRPDPPPALRHRCGRGRARGRISGIRRPHLAASLRAADLSANETTGMVSSSTTAVDAVSPWQQPFHVESRQQQLARAVSRLTGEFGESLRRHLCQGPAATLPVTCWLELTCATVLGLAALGGGNADHRDRIGAGGRCVARVRGGRGGRIDHSFLVVTSDGKLRGRAQRRLRQLPNSPGQRRCRIKTAARRPAGRSTGAREAHRWHPIGSPRRRHVRSFANRAREHWHCCRLPAPEAGGVALAPETGSATHGAYDGEAIGSRWPPEGRLTVCCRGAKGHKQDIGSWSN